MDSLRRVPTVLTSGRRICLKISDDGPRVDMTYEYPQVRVRREPGFNYAPFEVRRSGRHWEVRDPTGQLICLTVYRRGAAEVVRRLKLNLASNSVAAPGNS